MKLHLASGHDYREGYLNVDWTDVYKVDVTANILEPDWWGTVEESSVDEIVCNHFVEHIPHVLSHAKVDGLIWFMEQCYRVMKHGAVMQVDFPHFQSVHAYEDPTHCRFVTPRTFGYFDMFQRRNGITPDYGMACDFEVVKADMVLYDAESHGTMEEKMTRIKREWNVVYEGKVTLSSHKPMR